ncbi:hypothetical protein TNCV_2566331, partial [Trichonephila clavipes]
DFPEVINSIVVVKIPNPTDISLDWVPFYDHCSDIRPLFQKILNGKCRHWSSFDFLLFRRHIFLGVLHSKFLGVLLPSFHLHVPL